MFCLDSNISTAPFWSLSWRENVKCNTEGCPFCLFYKSFKKKMFVIIWNVLVLKSTVLDILHNQTHWQGYFLMTEILSIHVQSEYTVHVISFLTSCDFALSQSHVKDNHPCVTRHYWLLSNICSRSALLSMRFNKRRRHNIKRTWWRRLLFSVIIMIYFVRCLQHVLWIYKKI